ncbi:TPR_REGION domain-containing protein [Durusdinium trenchii]|uniref:TPR_REGION domain-containing protein n=1 Tax=Durusdinium trenchii TaxID=1381693 RepID=A0ABP0KMT4_9DINO
MAIYAWRNLQLVKHSCCGIDNVAVFLSRARKFAHPYLVPFLHLTPEYLPNLKKENKAMYNSFKEWWEQNGRKPPPPPAIEFNGEATWNWEWMKVVMPADRVPEGWEVFTQAALLYRLRDYEGARSALGEALRINSELALATDELLPGFHSFVPPRAALVPVRTKYLVCYNPQVGLGNVAVVMVSALNLARLTGRVLVVHWNTNLVTRHAWELLDTPGVRLLGDAAPDLGLVEPVKSLYMFHMMDSDMLAGMLELLGCSDLISSLNQHRIVTLSSNLYFTPILQTNPQLLPGQEVLPFAEGLKHMLTPSQKAKKRALSYANKTAWGSAPIVAVHIRAREAGEDNDDWPTAESPDQDLLVSLTKCIEQAVQNEFGDIKAWDVYLAATTEKARKVASEHLKQSSKKLRRILSLPKLERNRHTGSGAVDSMAEALLLSRADIFVRLVVGTTGFSTFAYLSNALRSQGDWAAALPPLRREGFVRCNYVVTSKCGTEHRCFEAPVEVRMADVSWHGKFVTGRSCGDVIARLNQKIGCDGLTPIGGDATEEEEL